MFEPVDFSEITPVLPEEINHFRQYLNRMTYRFRHPVTSFNGLSIRNEADVSLAGDLGVVLPALEVILAMQLPPESRRSDITLLSEFYRQNNGLVKVPDKTICRIRPSNVPHIPFETVVLLDLDYKAYNIISFIVNTLVRHLQGVSQDVPDDWARISQQLRKYAHSGSKHQLVMDESTMLYL
jgi:hypothetical protein